MTPRRSTARSRDIGQELLAIREKAGFDGLGLANRLGWDQSKVSRIERGKQAIEEVDLISWLTSCGVKYPRLRQLVDFNREATKETWVLPYGPASADSRNMAAEEQAAKAITIYAAGVVPGLLQTPDYAKAVTTHWFSDSKAIERAVAARMGRQRVLRGEKAPKVAFYIEEQVLLRPVGGEGVMHDQLLHLMFMADWKKVSIRVLRTKAGMHSAVQGSFSFIDRRDGRSLAWLDTRATAVILEGDDHIKTYQETIKELDALAMSEGQSRTFIASLAGGSREEPEDDGQGGVA